MRCARASGTVPFLVYLLGLYQAAAQATSTSVGLYQAAAQATSTSGGKQSTEQQHVSNLPSFLAASAESAKAPACLCDVPNGLLQVGNQALDTDNVCHISKVHVRQDHAGTGGMSLGEVSGKFGRDVVKQIQTGTVTLARVSETSFSCMDDRLSEPSLSTPGGDLAEFVLALSAYLQERDSTGQLKPTQEMVDAMLGKYLETIPASRPLILCTDDRAIQHLEAQLPVENLDIVAPPARQQEAILQHIADVENQGDSHFRLLLKQPEWYQLKPEITPMVLRSFYRYLWQQSGDPTSALHSVPKLKLIVLQGKSDPQAFFEVSSGDMCNSGGIAPMIKPRDESRSALVSHLDAIGLRRKELAEFFARVANATPRKMDVEKLQQRLNRHGWLALETTGSRIAAGLPFYTLTYA